MRRVMVVGQPGSGKSTVARALGERTGLPVVHLDTILWAPGWVQRAHEDRLRLAREAERGEAWIIEGNFTPTWAGRAGRADLLVWLDRPVAVRLWRVTARTLRWLGRTRPGMTEGCRERIGLSTLEFYGFIWSTRRTWREEMTQRAAGAPCPVVRLTGDGQVAAFLAAARDWPSVPPRGTVGPP